jgi:hypothetical protein
MTKPLVALFLIVSSLNSILSFAQKKPEAAPIMSDVTERGRALYEYDQAAWHATDAVKAMHRPEQSVGRYIAHKSDKGWVVGFGHLNEQRDKFLLAYEATQGATLREFSVRKLDPPQEDSTFYVSSARAIDTALHDFQGEKRPYNVALLPAPSNQFYVYVLPAQTRKGVYPLGGDARYLITPDGGSIVEKRQLHKDILEIPPDSIPKTTTPAGLWHIHVLTDVPEDTDVFHVLTRQPPRPEIIITRNKKLYEISLDGTIRESKM